MIRIRVEGLRRLLEWSQAKAAFGVLSTDRKPLMDMGPKRGTE